MYVAWRALQVHIIVQHIVYDNKAEPLDTRKKCLWFSELLVINSHFFLSVFLSSGCLTLLLLTAAVNTSAIQFLLLTVKDNLSLFWVFSLAVESCTDVVTFLMWRSSKRILAMQCRFPLPTQILERSWQRQSYKVETTRLLCVTVFIRINSCVTLKKQLTLTEENHVFHVVVLNKTPTPVDLNQ